VNSLGEHDRIVDVETPEMVPVLVVAAAQRAGRRRRRRIVVVVVRHVTAGARDVTAGHRAAAEVDGRQVAVDRAEMSELDVRLGNALTATGQV